MGRSELETALQRQVERGLIPSWTRSSPARDRVVGSCTPGIDAFLFAATRNCNYDAFIVRVGRVVAIRPATTATWRWPSPTSSTPALAANATVLCEKPRSGDAPAHRHQLRQLDLLHRRIRATWGYHGGFSRGIGPDGMMGCDSVPDPVQIGLEPRSGPGPGAKQYQPSRSESGSYRFRHADVHRRGDILAGGSWLGNGCQVRKGLPPLAELPH